MRTAHTRVERHECRKFDAGWRRKPGRRRVCRDERVERYERGERGDVLIRVRGEPEIVLDGIVCREPRVGFLSIELPPLEDWAERLSFLDDEIRARLEHGAFYDVLRGYLAVRWQHRERSVLTTTKT